MLDTYRKLKDLVDHNGRRQALFLFFMMIIMGLISVVSVGLILPFMGVLSNPELIENNRYLAYVYQQLGFKDSHSFLIFMAMVLLFAIIGSIAFRAFVTLAMQRFSQMQVFKLSRRLLQGYLNQPYDWFLDRHSADLGKTVLSEVAQFVNSTLMPVLQFISQVILALFLIAFLMIIDPLIALASAVGLGGAYAIVSYSVRNYARRTGAERAQANRQQFLVAQEALIGFKDVKIFGLEENIIERFSHPARHFAQSSAKMATVSQVPRFALEAIAFGGMLLIIMFLLETKGGVSAALPIITLYAFAAYRLLPALQSIYQSYSMIQYGRATFNALHQDMLEIAAQPGHGIKTTGADQTCFPLREGLELQNVWYSYPQSERPVLNDLSLSIPANKTVALVGGSGAGKTTIADIILGLLIPQAGEMRVDGQIITPAKVRAWQRLIGYVPQQIFLVDDTIAGNIAFGLSETERDEAEIERAARTAGLHQFVMDELPKGYQTMIGEAGVKLSGGQRQRIGIARALYRDPDVLILDEATNALDGLTERAVMDAIHKLSHTKTMIIIAHRLSTVKNCDQIFFIKAGRLQHQGTFQTLIDESEEFAELAKTGLKQ